MKSIAKTVRYDSVVELNKAVKEITKENHHNTESLRNIVANAFGTDGEKGIIASSVDRYFSKSPINWAE